MIHIMENAKKRYNEFLFKKYGFNRGILFENIPMIYKINPLFSPSLYAREEGKKFVRWFEDGLNSTICICKTGGEENEKG